MGKPDVDSIEGLSPAISIEQKTTSRTHVRPSAPSPRSTTTCACSGPGRHPLLARTGLPIEAQTVSQMVDRVMAMTEGTRLLLLAPVVRDRKGEYRRSWASFSARASPA